MLRPQHFRHELDHRAVFGDDIVARHLGGRFAEPGQGRRAVHHPGIVEHDAVGRRTPAARPVIR